MIILRNLKQFGRILINLKTSQLSTSNQAPGYTKVCKDFQEILARDKEHSRLKSLLIRVDSKERVEIHFGFQIATQKQKS